MAKNNQAKQLCVTSFFGSSSVRERDSEISSDSEVDETSPSTSSECTSRKRRRFMHHWIKLYPWLSMEGTGDELTVYCRDCKRAKLSSDFARGKKQPPMGWKKEYLQRHADSNLHKTHAQSTIIMAESAKTHFAPKSAAERETVGLLHDVYFILINGLPVYKSSPLHSFLDYQLQFFSSDDHDSLRQGSNSQLSRSHRSKHSTWEFVHALNRVVECDDLDKVRNASFYSLLVDESNDISVTKNLMLYVQFVDQEVNSVRVMFLKSLPLQGDSIAAKITEYLKSNEIDLMKMVMFTSDGAPVMLGHRNGVSVKLKNSAVPHLIENHCVAHKEALAAGQAYNSIAYFVQLENTIKAIYSHFSHSSVHTANLKSLYTILDQKYIKLKKIHDIRWLSRLEAVEALVRSYEGLVLYFEDLSNTDVVAAGLSKQLKTYRFVVSLHFLYDVLSCLGQLNKIFQIPTYHPYNAFHKVTEISDALRVRYLGEMFRWGPKANECLKKIERKAIDVREMNDSVDGLLKSDCVNFVTAVIDNLSARFPPTQQGIIEAAQIFDPKSLPVDDSITTYGEHLLDTLAIHYSSFVDGCECQSEWDMLKQCIKASYMEDTLTSFALKLATNEGLKIQYPTLSVLAEVILTYPASTAEVERGFSVQNTLKNKLRNRLGSDHLDQLIRMKLNAPKINEFPFHKAYINWLDTKKRRFVIRPPDDCSDSD